MIRSSFGYPERESKLEPELEEDGFDIENRPRSSGKIEAVHLE